MGTMILAVMTRVALAQDQRSSEAGELTAVMFLCIFAAAVLRVAAPFVPDFYLPLLVTSALAWIAGFAPFAVVHGRWMVRETR